MQLPLFATYTHPDVNLSGGRKRELLGKLFAVSGNTEIARLGTWESIQRSLYLLGANPISQSDFGSCKPHCCHTSEGAELLSSAAKAGELCRVSMAAERPFVTSLSVFLLLNTAVLRTFVGFSVRALESA